MPRKKKEMTAEEFRELLRKDGVPVQDPKPKRTRKKKEEPAEEKKEDPQEVEKEEPLEEKQEELKEKERGKKNKYKFYRLDKILKNHAQYNIIIGERSNGKTYSALEYGMLKYLETGKQFALIRRWREDFIGKRGQTMFAPFAASDWVKKHTNNEYNGIHYYASKWYFGYFDENGKLAYKNERPFSYAFSLSDMEHDKSTSYPDITTVIFDEFITRTFYMPDEFVIFMNVLSTIIRQRNDVTVFMLGNTVNKYCPYFAEMGLKHVKEMKQGTIDLYTYGSSSLKVAVEFCKPNEQGKKSDDYFAFDNPKLNMIKGGEWEIDIYPHLPEKFRPEQVVFNYYINFEGQNLNCQVVDLGHSAFTYVCPKTTELQFLPEDLIYSTNYSHLPNVRRNIIRPQDKLDQRVLAFIKKEKMFYSDNETGEIFWNYMKWCKQH